MTSRLSSLLTLVIYLGVPTLGLWAVGMAWVGTIAGISKILGH